MVAIASAPDNNQTPPKYIPPSPICPLQEVPGPTGQPVRIHVPFSMENLKTCKEKLGHPDQWVVHSLFFPNKKSRA